MESDHLRRECGKGAGRSDSDWSLSLHLRAMLILVASTILGTWLIIRFGPEAQPRGSSLDIWDELSANLISEPSDRILLVFWLLVGLLALLSGVFVSRQRFVQVAQGRQQLVAWVLLAVLVLVLVITLMRSTEPHDDWKGISPLAIAASALATAGLALLARLGKSVWLLINLLAGGVASVFLIGAGWQTHSSIRDPHHFAIALDDFMRGASGSVPYADYLPTYTALLGHPLALFRGFAGEVQVVIATYWILFLQIAAISLAYFIVRQATARKNQGLALLLLIAPVAFAQVGTGQSALQSAPIIPSRVFLPLLAFFLLVRALKLLKTNQPHGRVSLVIGGLLLGMAAINNVEFGAAAAAAGVITVVFAAESIKPAVVRLSILIAGIMLAVLLFMFGTLFADNPLDPANVIRIQLTYAAAGFDLHPITTIGPFMSVVLTAVLSIFLGLVALRSTPGSDARFTRGVVLLLMGLWTLFSMGYFTGRSFTSVLFAGLSIQLGVLLAVLADPAWKLISSIKWEGHRSTSLALSVLVLIPVFYGLTLLMGSNPPQKVLAFGMSGRPVVETRLDDFDQARSVIEDVGRSGTNEEILLIVGPSAVTSRIAQMHDGAAMFPGFIRVSKSLAEFQCKALPKSGFLIAESTIAGKLTSSASCQKKLSIIEDGVLLGPEVTSTIFRIHGAAG